MTILYRILKFCAIAATTLLVSCGTGGSSAPPPTGVVVTPGDSSITISWNGQPGVTYWLFFAQTSGTITPDNCSQYPSCQIFAGVTSPMLVYQPSDGIWNPGFTTNGAVSGLTNGAPYAFTLNGRVNRGPGGSGSPSLTATPRLAGSLNTVSNPNPWAQITAPTSDDLRGVADNAVNTYVAVSGNASNLGGVYYRSVGTNWSSSPTTWTIGTINSTSPIPNLNAVTASGNSFVAVGDGGTILLSIDAINWTPETSNTTSALYGVASNGAGTYVAVGASGTILYSSGGSTWTAEAVGMTGNTLYGVTYVYGQYIAVGAAGTLLFSTDGVNWTLGPTLGSGIDLKSVTYGGAVTTDGVTTGTNTYVVVGTTGAVFSNTGTDLTTNWSAPQVITAGANLNAVTYGHQFIAVGDSGSIYTSTDGIAWTQQSVAGVAGNLTAIAHGSFDYTAVGAAGLNLHAQ